MLYFQMPCSRQDIDIIVGALIKADAFIIENSNGIMTENEIKQILLFKKICNLA